MASFDAIVPQTSLDALQLGISSQVIVEMLLRLWESKNIKKQNKFIGITLLLIDDKLVNLIVKLFGPMYADLSQRRARVLTEEMQEGSSLFTVHTYVPVSESFSFADELRKGTLGGASALMVMSHWEMLEEDPFFVPKTEEEINEFGDGASVLPNTARKLISAVRRMKGLHIEEKVVQHATK